MEGKAAQTKLCTGCKEVFGADWFYRDARRADGLSRWCRGCVRAQSSEYHARHRAKRLAQKVALRATAGDHVKAARNEADRIAHKADPERYRARWRLYASKRRARSPEVNLRDRISKRLRHCLSTGKGGRASESLLGYTITELRAHLERQFLKGMSWENMREWHIDHIVPLSSFAITGPEDPELQRAWALPNLRPLWAADNMRKSAKRETLL